MTTWRRAPSLPTRKCLGVVIVHNADDEPIVLRDALVLIWDALERPRTEAEICGLVSDAATPELTAHVSAAVRSLEAVGVVARSP